MYGSIRKSYGAKKASRDTEKKERRILFGAKKKKNVEENDFQDTSYMNVEGNSRFSKGTKPSNNVQQNNDKNGSSKSEFPIASVILTIVFTMMVMVLAFGFGGI